MLDDKNVLAQRDPRGALQIAQAQFEQVLFAAHISQPDHDGREITRVIVTGMGGSALAASLMKTWLKSELTVPFEVVRSYDLPAYVDHHTLVIASSYSGNTEETLRAHEQAARYGAQIGIIAAGGELIERAKADSIAYVQLPSGVQPRMGVLYNLKALVKLLVNFQVIDRVYIDELEQLAGWLKQESAAWSADVTTAQNYAKQLALLSVGKSPIFYGGTITAPVAYKWKISWNENAKNVAFWNEYPEFNHNEFMGWTSHPVEKPFAVFDLISSFEHAQILKRFEISDRLLSGRRPKAERVVLKGDSVLAQLLWGSILADFVSIYVAVLNGVDPVPVNLIEKLKQEL